MSTNYVAPKGLNISKAAVETFAEQVAAALHLNPGDSLEEIVTSTGGQIEIGTSGGEDLDSGSIIARDMNDYVIYVSNNTSRQRDRFTVAHELGHLMLHLPSIKQENPSAVMRATRFVDYTDETQKRAEWEANWFAAALLMPREAFKEAFARGGLSEVQRIFDVSSSAAHTRAKSLALAV